MNAIVRVKEEEGGDLQELRVKRARGVKLEPGVPPLADAPAEPSVVSAEFRGRFDGAMGIHTTSSKPQLQIQSPATKQSHNKKTH